MLITFGAAAQGIGVPSPGGGGYKAAATPVSLVGGGAFRSIVIMAWRDMRNNAARDIAEASTEGEMAGAVGEWQQLNSSVLGAIWLSPAWRAIFRNGVSA